MTLRIRIKKLPGSLYVLFNGLYTVADLGGVRGVQMHPPLAASNVFLRT